MKRGQRFVHGDVELVEKLGGANESTARAESEWAEARVQELALQLEREQVRREKERLGWLQIGLLVLMDLILMVEIARLRRPILDWLRSRQPRPAAPAPSAEPQDHRFRAPLSHSWV